MIWRLKRPVVRRLSFGAAAAALVLAVGYGATALAAGPFDGLAGSWSGGGTIKMATGASERIRCRVTYAVSGGGSSVRQDLRCASDSYRFNLTASVASSGSSISGTWSETTRGVGGRISGTARGGRITALAEGSSFSANLTVTTSGNTQSVSIRSPGSEVREVSMSLRKGGN
jgi:hypothetical protein